MSHCRSPAGLRWNCDRKVRGVAGGSEKFSTWGELAGEKTLDCTVLFDN